MYNLTLVCLTVCGLILSSVFPRALIFAWATPDFLLLIVIFNAMFRGRAHGGVTGFLVGLAEDFRVGRFIGLNVMAKCVVGVLCGSLSKSIFKENAWVPVINVFIGSVINFFIVFVSGFMVGLRWNLLNTLRQGAFEILLNVCLVPFLYSPFFKFASKYINFDDEIS